MSNLAQTQANWNILGRELGFLLCIDKLLENVERKFNNKRSRQQVVEFDTLNLFTSAWTLSGVKIGTNTDENGKLFVRILDETPGAGQARVQLYRATGGGGADLMAQADIADGGTGTLAAQNSSGLTGTVKIGTVTATENNDKHYLLVEPDFPYRANQIFDGSLPDHNDVKKAALVAFSSIESTIQSARSRLRSLIDAFVLIRVANWTGTNGDPISETPTLDQGAVSVAFVGILEDLRKDMVDELTAGAQKVVKNVLSAGAGVFDAVNQGKGAILAPSVYEHARAGTITGKCVSSVVGSEQFLLTFKETTTGLAVDAENLLQVKKTYSDARLGISGMLLTRTLNLSVGSGNDFATSADFTVNGETPNNTESGKLYLKVVVGVIDPAKWKIQFYKNSTRVAAALVGETDEGAANAVVGINPKLSSGLSGTAKIGTAPTNGNTGTLDMQCFQTQSSGTPAVPDKFTVAITLTSLGEFQDRMRKIYQYFLNSAAAGSETLNEGYVKAGSFVPYSVRDV